MTAAELRRALELLPPGSALTLTREALLEALGNGTPAPSVEPPAPAPGEDPLLTPAEVAARLGTSRRWVYDHQRELGGRRLSRRCLRFPTSAVDRAIARRR